MRPHKLLAVGLVSALVVVLTGCNGSAMRSQAKPASWVKFSPSARTHWQIQLSGAFDASIAANIYDLDPYTTDQETITDLNAQGRQAICHLDVGVSDNALPDSGRLAADTLGAKDGDGGRWLDIRRWSEISPVLSDRFELCRAKGFQAIDADEAYGYARVTGFDLTSADQLTFDRKVAALGHSFGLAVGVRTTPEMAIKVEPFSDFAVVADCFDSPRCGNYFAFVQANKAVFDVETRATTAFCPRARYFGFAAISKPDDVLGTRVKDC